MNTYWHREKLKTLILLVIQKTESQMDLYDLMNRLFFIDMMCFGKTGKSISGATYIKTRKGIKLKGIEGVISEMIHEKSIEPMQLEG